MGGGRSIHDTEALQIQGVIVMDSPEGREAIPLGDAFGVHSVQNDNDLAMRLQKEIIRSF